MFEVKLLGDVLSVLEQASIRHLQRFADGWRWTFREARTGSVPPFDHIEQHAKSSIVGGGEGSVAYAAGVLAAVSALKEHVIPDNRNHVPTWELDENDPPVLKRKHR